MTAFLRGKGVKEDGFTILPGAFRHEEIENLICAISKIDQVDAVRNRGGVYAVRNLLRLSPAIDELAHLDSVRAVVEEHLKKVAFPVRGTFDKTSAANWLVPWHQPHPPSLEAG